MESVLASPFYRDILRECMTPELTITWHRLANNRIAWKNLKNVENNDETLRLIEEREALCKDEAKERKKSVKRFRDRYGYSISQPGRAYEAIWAAMAAN